jgi:hypothetical protein
MDSRERVLVRALPSGRVLGVRVVQRLTLTGTGDYFLSVPAPLLDVRAAPGSQAEPGFRRSGILWQGFANRRRVLAAVAELSPRPAADALPLRLELTATLGGRPLEASERRSGRLRLELKLQNTTAVRAPTASARPARPGDPGRIIARIASQVRQGEVPVQPTLEVEGPTETREFVVDAPLAISGEIRLRARAVDDVSVRRGSLVRRGAELAVRFRLVLAAPGHASSTIALTASVQDVSFPDVAFTATPSAAAAVSDVGGRGRARAAADAAALLLLRLARIRQYDAFLANPAPGGSVDAVYRFTTVEASSAAATAPTSDEDSVVQPVVVLVVALAGAGGLVVLWAHL